MRVGLYSIVVVTLLLLAPVVIAQDLTLDDGTDALMAGGGEDGGQFPDGTDRCVGDRYHHAHDYPLPGCVLRNNPHYATTVGGGAPCQERAKLCESCYDCCSKQQEEAVACHCYGSGPCESASRDVERTCRQACFGHFLDDCTSEP